MYNIKREHKKCTLPQNSSIKKLNKFLCLKKQNKNLSYLFICWQTTSLRQLICCQQNRIDNKFFLPVFFVANILFKRFCYHGFTNQKSVGYNLNNLVSLPST